MKAPHPPAPVVLLVEDEAGIRRFVRAALEAEGCTVHEADSLERGRIELANRRPDLLLLDLGLPDMDGTELIRHVALHHPACDVLVVTMFGDDRHVIAALEAGATGYLLKDAGADRIAASIHELHAGGSPISPGIARRVLARLRTATIHPSNEDP